MEPVELSSQFLHFGWRSKQKPFEKGMVYLTNETTQKKVNLCITLLYEGWNFNSGNYLFTTDTK